MANCVCGVFLTSIVLLTTDEAVPLTEKIAHGFPPNGEEYLFEVATIKSAIARFQQLLARKTS
ncbi:MULTISPECIES: hypothetical protein [unclassified Synechocystis]|uniref:hypothetical protein n=1 Tax=unclassified Synechocystis TaxID=2640012 RepID=UPI00041C7E04|nr:MULTISPECIES: hypothetical protein [unclassified Synechocystis]AIE73111.1 hypothetical protein D082_05820 [Synechocystis sp. PCC 6714]MCT0254366.1 hypothetical protein [Synechocystis sp. CS-94]